MVLPATTERSPGYWVEPAALDPGTFRVACEGCMGRTQVSGVSDESATMMAADWFVGHQALRHNTPLV